MMNVREQDNKPALSPVIAAFDAYYKNKQNVGYWSNKQIVKAQQFEEYLKMAYDCKDVYINYRKKFIAIKVDGPVVISELRMRLVNDLIDEAGFSKIVTAQGFIIRLFEK